MNIMKIGKVIEEAIEAERSHALTKSTPIVLM